MTTPLWQELWRRHAHVTTPLRQRGLQCDIEFGLSAYIVRVSLPDDSYLIIGPPQEPSSDRSPGDPEGWIVTREHHDDQALFEVIYDSAPPADPGAPERTEARHGGSASPLIEAIDQRLTQLGLLPAPFPPAGSTLVNTATPTLRGPKAPNLSDTADHTSPYVYGDALLALTDQLNGAETHADAAALLHQILDPTSGLLERLGDFFEAAGEKAREAETDDGFDLRDGLDEAAADLRQLGERLHFAVEQMRDLGVPQQPQPSAHTTARSAFAPVPRPASPQSGRAR
ncbi:hypothetical protein ACWF94_00405 [Streptomyces sp. NPDC055078]